MTDLDTTVADKGGDLDLTGCDREPIHIPGAVQPHGFLLVLDEGLTVLQGAGEIEATTRRRDWLGQPVGHLLGPELNDRLAAMQAADDAGFAGRWVSPDRLTYDVTSHRAGDRRVVEVEQSSQEAFLGIELLARLDAAGTALERAPTVKALCERAADEFRRLTGFDRVMIYSFLDDDAGVVLAEARSPEAPSFLNHHFPASDIPKQARALYVRNTVRVIPDVRYEPQPLRPPLDGATLDMSDCALRSVSPIHLQYMRNMDVRASASISIVMDGVLWGLVACHNLTPKLLPYELRVAGATLARGLARQLKAKSEADTYRERLKLRGLEDELLGVLPIEAPLETGLAQRLDQFAALLNADGAALMRGSEITRVGVAPPPHAVKTLGRWLLGRSNPRPFASNALSAILPEAADWTAEASGLMGVTVPGEDPLVLMAFRAEQIETVRWAGDPHAAVKDGPSGVLTPRASFEDWSETVRGRARRWSHPEVEAAGRLREALIDLRSVRSLKTINRTLQDSVADRDTRLQTQDFLLREVNHRVQNSLQLVSSFLALQARDHGDGPAADVLKEARRRIKAVSLVHSRLYRADQFETIDLSRYFGELMADMGESMGPEWAGQLTLDLAPVSVETSRAVTLGLVATELLINAQKYAYGGKPGPVGLSLEEERASLRLIVEDHGVGGHNSGQGFGSRMIDSLVGQLEGTLEYRKASPGLRVIVTVPIASSVPPR